MDCIVDIATDVRHVRPPRRHEITGKGGNQIPGVLLDEGFEMSQFSIYARFCNGKEHYETYLRRIEAHLPERGEIHVLNFKDKQYENIVRYSSRRRQRHRKNPDQLVML